MADASMDRPNVPMGRRERNKLRVKNRLYDAALRLFTEKGYEHTSVDEIAEEADVARRTFFNYFQRKEDLIDAWGERRRSHLQARLQASGEVQPRDSGEDRPEPSGEARSQDSGEVRAQASGVARTQGSGEALPATGESVPVSAQVSLERCMRALADINERERDVTQVMLLAWVKAGRPMDEEPYAAQIFADILETAKLRGEIAPGVNTRQAGYLLRDGYLGALYRWCSRNDDSLDLHEELNMLCDVVLHGIASPRD